MAKIHVQGVNGKNKDESQYTTPDVFTTSLGVKVRFIGLNQQRMETLRNAGTMPSVPYREMMTDFGAAQKEPLTADDLQTVEEEEQWREYVEKRDAIEKKRDENVMKYTFTSGFEILGVTDEQIDEWKEEQAVWGLEVPDNKIDVKFQYINTYVIGNNDDFAEIMAGIMERTGVPGERLDELRSTFRNQVRRDTPREVDEDGGVEGEVGLERVI